MIIFCEECGQRNILDPDQIQKAPAKRFRCQACGDFLRIADSKTVQLKKPAPPADPPKDKKNRSDGYSRLSLKFRGSMIEVSPSRPSITMGRQRHNAVVVEDNRVSRSHARFEYRQGKFVLIDQSTNGTYVFLKGRKDMNLRQDALSLTGSGFIGLGRKVTADSPEAINFSIVK